MRRLASLVLSAALLAPLSVAAASDAASPQALPAVAAAPQPPLALPAAPAPLAAAPSHATAAPLLVVSPPAPAAVAPPPASAAAAPLPVVLPPPPAAAAPTLAAPPAPLPERDDLLRLVPLETTAVWQRLPTPGTALLEDYAGDIVDAVAALRLDELLLSGAAALGTPPELLAELQSVRNVLVTVGAMLPWDDLLASEVLYAETLQPGWTPDLPLPSMLLALRPPPSRAADVERALAGMFGALTGLLPLHQRFDIERTHGADGLPTTLYRVTLPADPDLPLLQLAVHDGVFVAGLGPLYFERALALLHGEQAPRLADAERFRDAFAGLPTDVAGRRYLDVERLRTEVSDLAELADLTRGGELSGGLWQGLLGDALDLAGQLDTVAVTVQVDGRHLVTETVTRLAPPHAGVPEVPAPRIVLDADIAATPAEPDAATRPTSGGTTEATPARPAPPTAAAPDTARDTPALPLPASTPAPPPTLPTLLAAPCSGELLMYVPADVLAFEMRGAVDLVQVYRAARERAAARSPVADNLLWAFDVLQAAVDLSLERDVLSWLGSEHLSMEIPSRRRHPTRGQTDTVLLFKLDDPDGARRCLQRAEAVWQAASPRLLDKTRALLARLDPDLRLDVRVVPADGLFRSLRRLEVDVAGLPFPVRAPPLTFGVLGKLLVVATSPGAIEAAMAVAAGEAPGLHEHPFAAELLQPQGLTSAHLVRRGRQVEQLVGLLDMLQGTLTMPVHSGLGEGAATAFGEGCTRVRRLLAAFDFLGDEVAWRQSRDEGRVRYQRSTLRLRPSSERPFHRPASTPREAAR